MPRKPKSESLRVLSGDVPKKPKPIVLTDRSEPTPMCCLSAAERSDWDRLCDQLRPLGVLASADSAALTSLVKTLDRARQARADIDANGIFDQDSRGRKVRNPAVSILESAERESRLLMQALGLTASARKSLDLQFTKEQARSKLSQYLG